MGCGCAERREAISRTMTAVAARLRSPMSIFSPSPEVEKIDTPPRPQRSALRDLLRRAKDRT